MKRKLITAVIAILCVMLLTASCAARNDGTRTVQAFFGALNELDFKAAGTAAGNEELYAGIIAVLDGEAGEGLYERVQSTYFINFVYSNLTWKVTSSEKTDSGYSVKVRITAFRTEDILEAVQKGEAATMAKPAYTSADPERQYLMLINNIPEVYASLKDNAEKTTVTVVISVTEENGEWHLIPTEELFSAIGGM